MRALLYMQIDNWSLIELAHISDKSIKDVIEDLEALITAGMNDDEAYKSLKEYYNNGR